MVLFPFFAVIAEMTRFSALLQILPDLVCHGKVRVFCSVCDQVKSLHIMLLNPFIYPVYRVRSLQRRLHRHWSLPLSRRPAAGQGERDTRYFTPVL